MRLLDLHFRIRVVPPLGLSIGRQTNKLCTDAINLEGFGIWADGFEPFELRKNLESIMKDYISGDLRKGGDPFETIRQAMTDKDEEGFWWTKIESCGGIRWKVHVDVYQEDVSLTKPA